jgi:lipoprotein Spr
MIAGMKSWLTVQCAVIFGLNAWAQDTVSDDEQNNLKLCYHFSRLLDYEVTGFSNPDLYQEIYNWLGTPYKYAGDCKEGIDCSGFVCQLYQNVYGVKLSGSSGDLFKGVKPVKKTSLQEGDLVFFKIKQNRISHVGIYLGNNKFAHASVQNGVIISDLDDPYYKKYYYKGGRISEYRRD